MKKLALLIFYTCLVHQVISQVYLADSAKTRQRFAQLNLGLGFTNTSAFDYTRTFGVESPVLEQSSAFNELRFIIGGTHFWGHADFEISIPVIKPGASKNTYSALYSHGVTTSAKLYPWSIKKKAIRPYVGISINSTSYQQLGPDSNSIGNIEYRFLPRYHAGLSSQFGDYIVGIDAAYLSNTDFNYYTDPININQVKLNPWTIGVSIKKSFDTTLPSERSWKSGYAQNLADSLGRRGELNGLSLAAGFSAVYQLGTSSFNQENYRALGDHRLERFIDLGLGYYWHRPDIQVNIPFRQYTSELSAFNASQNIQRMALGIEALWFFADYHGFVPFIGPSVSYETMDVEHRSLGNNDVMFRHEQISYGLVFGWDIRPNRLQSIVLRTNLRYIPNLQFSDPASGLSWDMDVLEINFIQLVIYPNRIGKFR